MSRGVARGRSIKIATIGNRESLEAVRCKAGGYRIVRGRKAHYASGFPKGVRGRGSEDERERK